MSQSHPSAVSQRETRNTPYSLSYISANNNIWSRPNSQFDAAPAVPTRGGRRVQYRAKAKKAFKYAKKSLRMVSAYVKPGSSGSATAPTSFTVLKRANSRLSMHARLSVIEVAPRNTSTPSVCVTQPTIRGTNVRVSYQNTNVSYSVHRVPPTPEATQTFLADESDSPVSDKRKSMRFSHPAVNGVISGLSTLRPGSSGQSTIGEESASLFPGTPTTVATIEFEDQVNPKRVFRQSQMVSDGETFATFKDVMDGVKAKAKPAPRPTTTTTTTTTVQVLAAPPSLPYIALAPAMQLDDSEVPSPIAEQPVRPTRTSITVTFSTAPHPNTLTIGSSAGGSSLAKPRTTAPRPHTTGELANFLPYIPYNPRFNPYDHTLTPTPAHLTSPPSSTDLAAAFAEAEIAEQQLRHKRHTTLYADVEAGVLPPASSSTTPTLPPTTAAPKQTHQIKRKAVPAAAPASVSAPTAIPAPVFTVPVTESVAASTSKPLPPLPSPSSPRRFTQGFVPAVVPMGDGRYPTLEQPARAEKKERQAREKVSGGEKRMAVTKGKDVKRSRSQKVKAVENALRKLF
jgi:hypothetical protein